MLAVDRRKSIIHALHVFLSTPIQVYPVRESTKYLIAYEPKKYRVHYLMYKFAKNLINEIQFNTINEIKIDTAVDINVREDYRLSIKANNPNWNFQTKNVIIRIISTKYTNLQPLYGIIFSFEWRHTAKGGYDGLDFSIPECPIVSNHNTVSDVCYKKISSQVSGGGTHALQTYVILSKKRGHYEIAKWIKVSNETFHTYMYPVSVTL